MTRGGVAGASMALVSLVLAGCTAIAGLNDFHEVDRLPDAAAATDGGPDGAADGGLDGVTDGATPGADAVADAAPPAFTCDADIPLSVVVGDSPSGTFTGVDEKSGHVPFVGLHQRWDGCLPSGTPIELRAYGPTLGEDPSGYPHTWFGPCSGAPRSCKFTLVQPTTVTVELY